jgi:hypothetical protein
VTDFPSYVEMLPAVLAALVLTDVCPYPNETFSAGDNVLFFCIGMAGQLYDADDHVTYPSGAGECSTDPPANCVNETCDSSAKYVAKAVGALCACSHGSSVPDPAIGDGTQAIICTGTATEDPPDFDPRVRNTYTISGYRNYVGGQTGNTTA